MSREVALKSTPQACADTALPLSLSGQTEGEVLLPLPGCHGKGCWKAQHHLEAGAELLLKQGLSHRGSPPSAVPPHGPYRTSESPMLTAAWSCLPQQHLYPFLLLAS